METNNIINGVSLMAFSKNFKSLKLGEFVNSETSEVFKSLIFIDKDGKNTFVNFSKKLGELSSKEISKMWNSLQVVTLKSGRHKLCKQGSTWEDILIPGEEDE